MQVILNGNSKEKIDVVFVGSGFDSYTEFYSTVEEFVDYDDSGLYGLMSVKPFKSNKNKFNFWVAKHFEDTGNPNYKQASITMAKVYCPYGDNTILLSVTPRFMSHAYTIAFTDKGLQQAFVTIGCEYLEKCPFPLDIAKKATDSEKCQGYGNTTYCNMFGDKKEDVRRILLHEFGHSFGGLSDEYNTGKQTTQNPTNVPNCDSSGCLKWSSIQLAGCYQSCGYTNWYRAYENTLMNNPYDPLAEFGHVNENELKKDIDSFVSVPEQEYSLSYVIALNSEGELALIDYALVSGIQPNVEGDKKGVYQIKVMSFDNQILETFNFDTTVTINYAPSSNWFDETGDQIYVPNEYAVDITLERRILIVKYFKNAKSIDIFDGDNLLISISISKYHDLDGDKIPAVVDDYPLRPSR